MKFYFFIARKHGFDFKFFNNHCKETAGHLGSDKTIERIKSRFFWTNLSRDVKKFVKELPANKAPKKIL